MTRNSKQVIYASHLEDALRQQDFLKSHLDALKQALLNGESTSSPEDIAEQYQHLLSLNANQQIIMNDMLAVQQTLLSSPDFIAYAQSHPEQLNAQTIGAIRRAQTPMLQLVRDNEVLLQKLMKSWKNLCQLLGMNTQQSMRENLEALSYQLGIHHIRYELNLFNLALKHLEQQQQLIDNKLKAIARTFASEPDLSEDDAVHLKLFLDEAKKIVALTLVSKDEIEPVNQALPEDQNTAVPAPHAQTSIDDQTIALEALFTMQPLALNDDQRQNLEQTLGIEQTNHLMRQIQALHIQGNRFLNQQRQLQQRIHELDKEATFHKRKQPDQPSPNQPEADRNRLAFDAQKYRTLFLRPDTK